MFDVLTFLSLSSTRVSYRYHLAHRTYTGELEMRQTVYVSLPESHMIIMLKTVDSPANIETNWVRVVGSGERCLPGDNDNCGDGGKAVDASRASAVWPGNVVFNPIHNPTNS